MLSVELLAVVVRATHHICFPPIAYYMSCAVIGAEDPESW
jgi:hypothetical protein